MSSVRISPLPETPYTLADVATLQAELGGTADGLAGYLQQATALIETFISRPLGKADYLDTFRLNGHARRSLTLGRFPVLSVASLSIDGADWALDSLDLDPNSGLLYPPGFGCGAGAGDGLSTCGYALASTPAWCGYRITVGYSAGYVLPGMVDDDGGAQLPPTLPADLVRACLDTAKALYHARDRDPLVRSETEQGIGSTSWLDPDAAAGGLPRNVAAMLGSYRRVGLS